MAAVSSFLFLLTLPLLLQNTIVVHARQATPLRYQTSESHHTVNDPLPRVAQIYGEPATGERTQTSYPAGTNAAGASFSPYRESEGTVYQSTASPNHRPAAGATGSFYSRGENRYDPAAATTTGADASYRNNGAEEKFAYRNQYEPQRRPERQGMSDTRFIYGGQLHYDVGKERDANGFYSVAGVPAGVNSKFLYGRAYKNPTAGTAADVDEDEDGDFVP